MSKYISPKAAPRPPSALLEMTDEEKEKFYVNLTLTYTGREYYEEDYIIFLRNDNVYEGDLYDGDDTIGLSFMSISSMRSKSCSHPHTCFKS